MAGVQDHCCACRPVGTEELKLPMRARESGIIVPASREIENARSLFEQVILGMPDG